MRDLRHDADCHAWPWVSVEEFFLGACALDHDRARRRLRERMKIHGYPEITPELVEHLWGRDGEPLWRKLQALGREHLTSDGEAWRLVADRAVPGREVLRWRYLSLALPPGLLTAAAADGKGRPSSHVDLLHGSFGPVGPVAHLHLHVYAACSFEVLWTHRMGRRTRLRLRSDTELPAGWTAAGRTAEDWAQTLVHAAVVRRVLTVLGHHPDESLAGAMARVGREHIGLVRDAVAQLRDGAVWRTSRVTRGLMFRVATRSPRAWVQPRALVDVWRNDPIDDGGEWPEGSMLRGIFARLERARDPTLEGIFVQYLRVKCLTYRLLVYDTTDRGLDSFVHKFRQMGPYREGLEDAMPDLAMAERSLDLRALEVRTAPPETVTAVRRKAKDLVVAAERRDDALEVGWVFHFIREARGVPATTGAGYQAQFRQMRADALRLRQALTLRPRLLTVIRGLDIAGSERAGPLWIAVPFFKRLRELSHGLASTAGGMPLRCTIHVGEDFRHLASGLRAIHEPMQWAMIERGDRFGHALALGLDPVKWCARNPRVLMPRWERMMDLAWMIAALEGEAIGLQGLDRDDFGLLLARMRKELARLLNDCEIAVMPDNVIRLHAHELGMAGTMPWLMDRRSARPAADHPRYIAWLRLFGEARVQAALDRPCEVETAGELPLLRALSRALVRLVALWQLVIEINPSSNLLVAGFEEPLDQPIFRLHPLDPGEEVALPITLNADDPLTVATTLADEYAYAWVAMVLLGGVAPGRAHMWLREAGCASLRAKFTLPAAQRSRLD